jgi:hypothetical protein
MDDRERANVTDEVERARALYERVRRDSGFRMEAYRAVVFVAQMMKRDPFAVLHAIGDARVAADDHKEQRR